MPTIYQIGSDGYWTGAAREISGKDGVPRGWTRFPVPTLMDGQYAAWGGGNWAVVDKPPPGPSIEDLRAKAHADWVAWLDQFLDAFLEGYPRAEPLAWSKKEAAAEAYDDGVATQRQITALTNEADAKGGTVADLVASIIAKAEPFNRIIEFTSGLRSRTQAQIDAATPADLQGILDAAKAEALAKAQEIRDA